MNGKLLAAALLVSSLAFSAHAQKPQIQWNNKYNFQNVKTFAWQDTPETSLEQSNPFMDSLIKNTLEAELSTSGLTEVESNPDVYVNYHASTSTDIQLRSDSWLRLRRLWHGHLGRVLRDERPGVDYDARRRVTMGTLVVDIWDAATKELVWRGEVSDSVSDKSRRTRRRSSRPSASSLRRDASCGQRS